MSALVDPSVPATGFTGALTKWATWRITVLNGCAGNLNDYLSQASHFMLKLQSYGCMATFVKAGDLRSQVAVLMMGLQTQLNLLPFETLRVRSAHVDFILSSQTRMYKASSTACRSAGRICVFLHTRYQADLTSENNMMEERRLQDISSKVQNVGCK